MAGKWKLDPEFVSVVLAYWDGGKTAAEVREKFNLTKGQFAGIRHRYRVGDIEREKSERSDRLASRLSNEQTTYFELSWRGRTRSAEIFATVNAMPGYQVANLRELRRIAQALNLSRPEGFRSKRGPKDEPKPRRAPKVVPARASKTQGITPIIVPARQPVAPVQPVPPRPLVNGLTVALTGIPGSSGVPLAPFSLPWSSILDHARADGWPLANRADLASYNRSRERRFLQPLAVRVSGNPNNRVSAW
jgi:hypothetical protein